MAYRFSIKDALSRGTAHREASVRSRAHTPGGRLSVAVQPKGYEPVPLSDWSDSSEPPPDAPARIEFGHSLTMGASLIFVVAAAIYLATGLWCIHHPRGIPFAAEVPQDAVCVDVERRSHYTHATLTIGRPRHIYKVLLRLDLAVDCDDSPALVMTSPNVLLSESISCPQTDGHASGTCTDSMLIYRRGSPHHRIMSEVQFLFGTESLRSQTASRLGLDGEMYMCRGSQTVIQSHEVCMSRVTNSSCAGSSGEPYGRVIASVEVAMSSTGRIWATPENMINGGTPFALAPACGQPCSRDTQIFLMDDTLYAPNQFLFMTQAEWERIDSSAYEHLVNAIELGTACMSLKIDNRTEADDGSDTRYTRWLNLMCTEIYGACEQHDATFAYSRLSRHWVWISLPEKGRGRTESTGCVTAMEHQTLQLVPRYDENNHAITLSYVRLTIMLIAAAIVYLRSSNVVVRVDSMLRACIWNAIKLHTHDHGNAKQASKVKLVVDFEQVIMGLLACASRMGIVLARREALLADGQKRVVEMELIASVASILHWAIHAMNSLATSRGVADMAHGRDALMAIGGSSAVVDIACATMLAFADTPVRGGTSSFDVVARLLTAVLITLVCVTRCIFSASCSGVLVGYDRRPQAFVAAIVGSAYWAMQTIAIAIVLIDLFVTPTSEGWWRKTVGDTSIHATALFIGLSTLSGPRISANACRVGEMRREQLNTLLPARKK